MTGLDLTDRVALVTGAVEGIGWASASALADAGASVVLVGRTDDERLDARVAELRDRGATVLGMASDVRDAAQVADCYRKVFAEYGRLDVLISNAGVLGDARIGMIGETMLSETLETNLHGSLRHLQAAGRLMSRQRSGSIVLLSSIVGVQGNSGQVVYAASKAGLIGAVRSAAKELGPVGVRVNAIAPGYVATRMISHLSPEVHQERVASIPLGRVGTAQDVASVALFLASDLAGYVTGQVIGVDGAMTI